MDNLYDIEKIHTDEEQNTRLQSAKKGECTPISIDIDNRTGKFSGRYGIYETTLEMCNCFDFEKRDKPCKHMYRLAIELGLINETAETDPSKIKAPPPEDSYKIHELFAKINDLPDDTQILLKDVLLNYIYRKFINIGIKNTPENQILIERDILKEVQDYGALLRTFPRNKINAILDKEGIKGFKRNMSQQNLIKWCCEFAPNLPLGNIIAVTIAEKACAGRHQLYKYLKSKYPDEPFDI